MYRNFTQKSWKEVSLLYMWGRLPTKTWGAIGRLSYFYRQAGNLWEFDGRVMDQKQICEKVGDIEKCGFSADMLGL